VPPHIEKSVRGCLDASPTDILDRFLRRYRPELRKLKLVPVAK